MDVKRSGSQPSGKGPAEYFVAFAMSQPEDVDVNEVLFRPTRQEL